MREGRLAWKVKNVDIRLTELTGRVMNGMLGENKCYRWTMRIFDKSVDSLYESFRFVLGKE